MRLTTRAVITLLLAAPLPLAAQADPREPQVAAVADRLFAAMRSADTAAVRAQFTTSARIIPFQPNARLENIGPGLTVDQFVAFSAHNAPGQWIERVWHPTQHLNGPLADLWFEYDVFRGAVLDHCGVNSVQLQETAAGWRIVSMAFTSQTAACPSHPAPGNNGQ